MHFRDLTTHIELCEGIAGCLADEQCLVLNISGAAQSVINGHYHLDRSFELHCGSHSVWTKSASSSISSSSRLNRSVVYIYYQEDGYDGWVIS